MSERRFDDSPAPEDERALREAWQGDTPPAPDAALDARVRAAVGAPSRRTAQVGVKCHSANAPASPRGSGAKTASRSPGGNNCSISA